MRRFYLGAHCPGKMKLTGENVDAIRFPGDDYVGKNWRALAGAILGSSGVVFRWPRGGVLIVGGDVGRNYPHRATSQANRDQSCCHPKLHFPAITNSTGFTFPDAIERTRFFGIS